MFGDARRCSLSGGPDILRARERGAPILLLLLGGAIGIGCAKKDADTEQGDASIDGDADPCPADPPEAGAPCLFGSVTECLYGDVWCGQQTSAGCAKPFGAPDDAATWSVTPNHPCAPGQACVFVPLGDVPDFIGGCAADPCGGAPLDCSCAAAACAPKYTCVSASGHDVRCD